MGRIRKGVLGGFSGTVGTVVGSNWNGIDCMRSLPTASKSRKSSPKQLEQQARFTLANRFVRTLSDLFMETYDKVSFEKTGINTALSDVVKRAVAGNYPLFSIQYNLVYVSRGSLPNAATVIVAAGPGGTLAFNWSNAAAGIGKESPNDQVLLVAHCPELNRSIYRIGALRSAAADTLVAAAFIGKTVHTWATFISEDGQDYADSLYTGEVIVLAD